ncbi:uracil DNA glycosylase [Aspergillus hancockii]|nr:uracil DNA glycosylase [Aspergillus hancockii]
MLPSSQKRNANHLTTPTADAKKPKNGSITSFFGAPKAKTVDSKSSSTVSSSFDKQKWVALLTLEQRELLQLEIDTLHESWLAQLKEELLTPEFLALKRFLQKEKQSGAKIFPPENEIYSWSQHTPLNKVKVVIVGQDPYHNHNQAHGLAFSVRPPTPAPPSLANIYTGIKNDYPSFERPPNKGGLLTPWAERGFTNGHFKKCNEWLAERYGPDEVIDWSLTSKIKTSSPFATIQCPSAPVDKPTENQSKSGVTEAADKTTECAKPQATDEFDDDADALEALAAAEAAS